MIGAWRNVEIKLSTKKTKISTTNQKLGRNVEISRFDQLNTGLNVQTDPGNCTQVVIVGHRCHIFVCMAQHPGIELLVGVMVEDFAKITHTMMLKLVDYHLVCQWNHINN